MQNKIKNYIVSCQSTHFLCVCESQFSCGQVKYQTAIVRIEAVCENQLETFQSIKACCLKRKTPLKAS